ncbi:MAG: hypothetical protein A2284_03590 [Deltaproteobacteria bacterium RIFOXYA12_FULL_61_11]|nr:MAG: hypothetical protein A2284_03590 [Deltaproteobacteria bacterium RIFOXYA12_FULL_61_11]
MIDSSKRPHHLDMQEIPRAILELGWLLDAFPFPVLIVDEQHTIYLVNKVVAEQAGRTPAELQGAYCPRVIHGLDEYPHCPMPEALATNGPVEREVYDPDTDRWFAVSLWPLPTFPGLSHRLFLHAVRDITEQMQATRERSIYQNLLNGVLDAITDPLYIIDVNTYEIITGNRASGFHAHPKPMRCHQLTHRSPEPCGGANHYCPLVEVMKTRSSVTVEHVHYGDDDQPRYYEVHAYPVFDEDGSIGKMVEYSVDISRRKQLEKSLTDSLKQKDLLLAEVHHRVKNNLAIVASILSQQARQHLGQARETLLEAKERITAMALIHETLYANDTFDSIDIARLARSLAHAMTQTKVGSDPSILPQVVAPDRVRLELDQAIPCGMLLNELLSNSFQHAFVGRKTGTVVITIVETAVRLRLIVMDDGIGFDRGATGNSLGMRLINALVEQLEATLTIDSSALGTRAEVEFTRQSRPSR